MKVIQAVADAAEARLKSAAGQMTDSIGMAAGTVEALRLHAPPTQFSTRRGGEAQCS
jgi:hypothetical protein